MIRHESSGFRLHPGRPRPTGSFSRQERQTLFRGIAAGEFRRGPMTRDKWRQLVQYAAVLDLTAVEAGELLEEARDAAAEADEAFGSLHLSSSAQAAGAWPLWVKLAVGAAVLAFVDAMLCRVMF